VSKREILHGDATLITRDVLLYLVCDAVVKIQLLSRLRIAAARETRSVPYYILSYVRLN
jgi:hypothetical protein